VQNGPFCFLFRPNGKGRALRGLSAFHFFPYQGNQIPFSTGRGPAIIAGPFLNDLICQFEANGPVLSVPGKCRTAKAMH
jgi:hypothetical protein